MIVIKIGTRTNLTMLAQAYMKNLLPKGDHLEVYYDKDTDSDEIDSIYFSNEEYYFTLMSVIQDTQQKFYNSNAATEWYNLFVALANYEQIDNIDTSNLEVYGLTNPKDPKSIKKESAPELDVRSQMVLALLNKTTIDNALQMFKPDFQYNGHKDRMPIELYGISFRLFKASNANVNLEFLISNSKKSYFQPIGAISKNSNVYILNEFATAYNKLESDKKVGVNVKFFPKRFNAIIAACAMSTLEYVSAIFVEFNFSGDNTGKKFICNGLKCELRFGEDNDLQFFVLDEYETLDKVTVFHQQSGGELAMTPTIGYMEAFEKTENLQLLTAFKN